MAKGNLILGTASGKLGDTVMYRKDGQQLSRVRVRKIGNPRTESQAVNRALLNTLSTAYAYMKGIVDHSFQGLSKPVENQRKFAKLNQGIARETGSVAVPGTDTGYNFNFKGESLLRPNRYAISRGTMPSVEVFNIAAAGGLIAGFQLNQALSALLDTTTTYADFCAAIGVPVGTQLTFCIVSDDTFAGTPSESNMPKSYGNFHFARIILSDDNGNGDVPMFASQAGDIVINSNYANSKNSGALKFKRLGETSLRIEVENQSYPLAMGVIVSNYSSRMWLRSNTDMVVAEGYEDSNTMSEVYMSYMQSESTPTSTLYLNQGEGTIAATDEGGTIDADAFGYMYKGSTNPVKLPRTYEGPWYEVQTEAQQTVITSEYPMKNAATIANETSNFVGILARDPGQAVTMIKSFDPDLVPDVGQQLASMQYPCYVYAWENSSSAQFNLLFQAENDVKNILFNLTIS